MKVTKLIKGTLILYVNKQKNYGFSESETFEKVYDYRTFFELENDQRTYDFIGLYFDDEKKLKLWKIYITNNDFQEATYLNEQELESITEQIFRMARLKLIAPYAVLSQKNLFFCPKCGYSKKEKEFIFENNTCKACSRKVSDMDYRLNVSYQPTYKEKVN